MVRRKEKKTATVNNIKLFVTDREDVSGIYLCEQVKQFGDEQQLMLRNPAQRTTFFIFGFACLILICRLNHKDI